MRNSKKNLAFRKKRKPLKKYANGGIQLGSSNFSGEDTSLSQNYGLTPEQQATIETGPQNQGGPKESTYAEWSGLDTAGQVQTALGVAQGLGNIYGAATMDTDVSDPTGYYNRQTKESLEASNRGVRDSQIASTTGQTIMAASAYAGPFAWIPLVVGGLTMAGGEIGKAVHKGRAKGTAEDYGEAMAARGRAKRQADLMKKRNERFQDVDYFGSTGNVYAKKGGLVKYQGFGNGVTRVYGDYHKDGGIPMDFDNDNVLESEVENKEVLDKSDLTKAILKNAGKDGQMYIFSEYLNEDGTKGYDDPNKKSIADARMEIEKDPTLSPEQKLVKTAELMDKQEKGANRKAKFAKGGGLMKYKEGGIHIKPENVGSLRAALGTPEGENIPAKDLEIKPGDSKAMQKKKTFAKNARKWNKTGGLIKYRTAGEVPEYDPGSAYPTNLEGSNEEIVYRRLRENGLTDTAAKAVLANIITESDRFRAQEEYAPNKYGTKGYGIAQWTDTKYSKRRKMFNDYMEEKDLDPELLENQVDYLVYEINNHPENMPLGKRMSIETLNSMDDLEEATDYFMKGFEAPKDQSKRHLRKRLKAYEDSTKTSDLSFTGEPTTSPTVTDNQRDLKILQSKWGANPQGYTPEDLQSFYEMAQEQDRLQIESEAAGNPTGSTAFAGDFYDEDAGAFKPGMSAAENFYNKYSTAGTDYIPPTFQQITMQQNQALSDEQALYDAAQKGAPYPKDSTYEDLIAEYENRLKMDDRQIAAEAARARGEDTSDPSHPYSGTALSGTYYDPETETWADDYMSAQKFYDKYQLDYNFDDVDKGAMTPPPAGPSGAQQPGGPGAAGGAGQGGTMLDPNMYDAQGRMVGPVDFTDMRGAVDEPENPKDPKDPKGLSKREMRRLATIGGLTAAQLALLASAKTDYAEPMSLGRLQRPLRIMAPRLRDTRYAGEIAERRAVEAELAKTTGPTGARRQALRQETDRGTESRQLGIAAENARRYMEEQKLNLQAGQRAAEFNLGQQQAEEASRVAQQNAELMTKLSKQQAISQSLGNIGQGLMGYWGDEDLARAYSIDGTYDRYRYGKR